MKTTKTSLQIGQILYNSNLYEFKINKIGKKYFTCEGSARRFLIESLKSASTFRLTQLYDNRQTIFDKEDEAIERLLIINCFDLYKTTLSIYKLRRISQIINEPKS